MMITFFSSHIFTSQMLLYTQENYKIIVFFFKIFPLLQFGTPGQFPLCSFSLYGTGLFPNKALSPALRNVTMFLGMSADRRTNGRRGVYEKHGPNTAADSRQTQTSS